MKYKLIALYRADLDKLRKGEWEAPDGWRAISFNQDPASEMTNMLLEQIPTPTYREPE